MTPKYVILSDFETHGFDFPKVFRKQGLEEFINERDIYYPSLVKDFYSNLVVEGEALISEVKKVAIFLSHHDFGVAFKFPSPGLRLRPNLRGPWEENKE